MDHVHGADWSGVAFWLFIAAVVVGNKWEKSRRNAEQHETLRRIIDKTGVVDEAKLKELFAPPQTPDWLKTPPSAPGGGYRALRITGAIIMGFGAALAVLAVLLGQIGPPGARPGSTIALSMAFAIAFVGLAVFLASRFASPPPDQGNGRDR